MLHVADVTLALDLDMALALLLREHNREELKEQLEEESLFGPILTALTQLQ